MRPRFWRSKSEQMEPVSPPDDGSAALGGARPRRCPPRGASADRGAPWNPAGGDTGSPTELSGSAASLNSNRDSGYVPSPAGAVRFDLDPETTDLASPPPRRPATRPIAIPCRSAGLPPPEESELLRRRLRRIRAPSSSEEDEGQEDQGEDREDSREEYGEDSREEYGEDSREEYGEDSREDEAYCGAEGPEDSVEYGVEVGEEYGAQGPAQKEDAEDGQERGAEREERGGVQEVWVAQGVDTVDQREASSRDVELLYRETQWLQVGWREGAVLPPRFQFRAELPDVVPAGAPIPGGAAPARRPRPRPRPRPASRASSASLSVELDVGRELREIADALPISRSAPGALQLPRRDIWTLLRRTFDFGVGRGAAPRPRRASDRQ